MFMQRISIIRGLCSNLSFESWIISYCFDFIFAFDFDMFWFC